MTAAAVAQLTASLSEAGVVMAYSTVEETVWSGCRVLRVTVCSGSQAMIARRVFHELAPGRRLYDTKPTTLMVAVTRFPPAVAPEELAAWQYSSPTGGMVNSESCGAITLARGNVVRHGDSPTGSWCALVDVFPDKGPDGGPPVQFVLLTPDGETKRLWVPLGSSMEVRTDMRVRFDPAG
jgi:hypothetical protein